MVNGNLLTNETKIISGFAARVRRGRVWGFAAASDPTHESVTATISQAAANAECLGSLQGPMSSMPSSEVHTARQYLATKKARKSIKEILEFVAEVDSHCLRSYPKISGRRLWLNCFEWEKSFISSSGSVIDTMIPATRLIVFLSASNGSANANAHVILGNSGHFEDVFEHLGPLYERIDTLYEHLMRKLEGVVPDAGEKECILGPELTGLLAHETIMPPAKASSLLGRNPLVSMVGRVVGSPVVSLVDFAHTAFGQLCPAPVFFDDEGVRARDLTIIENGVFRGYMHDRESADILGGSPSGHARAASFMYEPVICCRNAAILPGSSTLEEMIASVDNGYYFTQIGDGYSDMNSNFMAGIVAGYEIKNGRIGRAVRHTSISGNLHDVWKSVTMLSDRLSWLSGGFCGLGPLLMPMGLGGPASKCRVLVGGK